MRIVYRLKLIKHHLLARFLLGTSRCTRCTRDTHPTNTQFGAHMAIDKLVIAGLLILALILLGGFYFFEFLPHIKN